VLLAKTAFRIKIPVIIREASTSKNFKHTITRWLVYKLYPKAEGVVAVTHEIAREMIELIGVPRNKISIIHNPVNISLIQQKSRQTVSHAWLDNKEYPVIIAVGRLIPAKDYETLVEAMSILNKHATIRLIIIGEGTEKLKIASRINQEGLYDRIDMLGYQENPYAYMKHADLLVVSSVYEGFVNVLLEAMSLGVPVVSTKCPSGPAEILDNGRFGKLVAVGDPVALADAINSTLSLPISGNKLMDRARDFSLEKIVAQYINLFSKFH